ncbi:response regulator transcription factor [Actinomadura sp. NEAU-AAG7]|uniref:response regulator n=1 Tax=Actinomadura sp. NEAU-AAG7 TaxID=2839640 RepID=UPI001BE48E49|nr:response regulator transcription factor [Actinomadura sp. NEAU-AAG7]MBT2207462.1 response regulator transcription factor [Actinomadura sp. NEAU-AAG7]
MIRVLIADDQALIRVAFRMIVGAQPDMEVAGEAADGAAAVALTRRLRPDVVLMDVRMPELDGIEATRRIIDALPRTRVLAVSTFDLDEHVVAALRAGASGFLPLDVSPEELTEAIRIVHRGDAAVAPRLLTYLIGTFIRTARPRPAAVPPTLAGLSARELDILVLIARGSSNADIAGALSISESTVKNHVTSVFGKLRIRDRAQAVIAAYEAGLVTPGDGAKAAGGGRPPASSARPED